MLSSTFRSNPNDIGQEFLGFSGVIYLSKLKGCTPCTVGGGRFEEVLAACDGSANLTGRLAGGLPISAAKVRWDEIV